VTTEIQALSPLRTGRGRGRTHDLFLVILALAVAINGCVMLWLWLRDGGITSQFTTSAGVFTSAGRITGLVGAYFALIQVLLIARLPPLERRVGLDRLTVWHRINGKLVIYLVVAHVILITIGYAGTIHAGWFKEFSAFLSSYPGMITATIGTALMLLVVISSLVIARRRLPYEVWYGVHLSVYAGIYLAYLHQIPAGNEFLNRSFTQPGWSVQSYWWLSLYVATLVLILVYRVLLPVLRFYRLNLRVTSVEPAGPNVTTITITGRHLERLGAAGGQFMIWRFLAKGFRWQAHPFSLSAAPDGRTLRITVKCVGGYTRRLRQLPVGTRVFTEGPFGRFVARGHDHRHVTLIAGGIGVTPLRAMLEELDDASEVTFIYRAVNEADLVLRDEIEELTARRGAQLHELVGDHADPRYAELLAAENLLALAPEIARSDVYLCGPLPMMHHTLASLERLGVPRHQIHREIFAFAAS
jgi:predicted ferric reductase